MDEVRDAVAARLTDNDEKVRLAAAAAAPAAAACAGAERAQTLIDALVGRLRDKKSPVRLLAVNSLCAIYSAHLGRMGERGVAPGGDYPAAVFDAILGTLFTVRETRARWTHTALHLPFLSAATLLFFFLLRVTRSSSPLLCPSLIPIRSQTRIRIRVRSPYPYPYPLTGSRPLSQPGCPPARDGPGRTRRTPPPSFQAVRPRPLPRLGARILSDG